MGAPLLSVAKKSFRHADRIFQNFKSSEKWGSSSCRTPFRVSRTHPSAPLTKGFLFGGQTQGIPAAKAAGIPFSSSFLRYVPPEGRFLRKI